MGRTLIITAACAFLWGALTAPAAGASAASDSQSAAPAQRPGLYQGGATGRYVHFVSLRLNRPRTRAEQRATLVARCQGDPAIPTVLDNLRLSEITVRKGRARGSGVVEEQISTTVPGAGGLSRRGTVHFRIRVGTGGRAAGIIRSRFTLTDPATGSRRARCDTGAVRWSARIAGRGAGRGKPAPVPGAAYFGTTAQRQPFLLEVLRGGRAVRPAGMTFRGSCPSLRDLPLDLAATVKMPIRHGRFGARGLLTRRYSSDEFGPVTERYTWRLAGRFGAQGVAGAWRVSGVVTRDSDGAEVGSCTTGRNRWRAVR